MGTTQKQIAFLIEDLKTSWYFRIWALIWLICFITWVVALGVLAHRASQGVQEKSWRVYVKDESDGIPWPEFLFELTWDAVPGNVSIVENSIHCYFEKESNSLDIDICFNGKTVKDCFTVKTDGLTAVPNSELGVSWIQCRFNTTGWKPGVDDMVMWTTTQYRTNMVFIRPSAEAWLTIGKSEFKAMDESSFRSVWSGDVKYESSVHDHRVYDIAVIINRFFVLYAEEYEFYNGLMSASDLGGFAFFLSLLATVVMLLVGVILENDSKFLKA